MTADHDSRFTVLLKFCDSPQNRQNENRNEAGRPIGKLDPAPHGSSYVVRNGKAYAGAGTSFIKPLAALDDGLELMIGNAGAVIRHAEADLAVVLDSVDPHLAPRMMQRVLGQCAQRLSHVCGIDYCLQASWHVNDPLQLGTTLQIGSTPCASR